MDKLLIVAAKLYNDPTGGGGTVVKNLIDLFIDDFEIDLVLYRTPTNDFYKHNNLKTNFHPIYYRDYNKFTRRILNYEYNFKYLNGQYNLDLYRKIIIIHTSKMFGLEKLAQKHLKKIVLFPMYLSPAYRRSNETVPPDYTELEQKALNSANYIITPSESEKNDIVNYYNIEEGKLEVVNRGVNEVFFNQPRDKIHFPIKLLVVSTIKEQKNIIESAYILKILIDSGLIASLSVIGRIESSSLYDELEKYLELNSLSKYFSLIQGVNQNELAKEMRKADILILPSLWETFGRVVYEGLATGLSVVIRKGIDCFANLYEQDFIFSYTTIDEAAEQIIKLSKDDKLYRMISAKAINFSEKFSSLIENKKLKEAILCKD
jgi:glycosyltransferase involved in cell wall biosynthesis